MVRFVREPSGPGKVRDRRGERKPTKQANKKSAVRNPSVTVAYPISLTKKALKRK